MNKANGTGVDIPLPDMMPDYVEIGKIVYFMIQNIPDSESSETSYRVADLEGTSTILGNVKMSFPEGGNIVATTDITTSNLTTHIVRANASRAPRIADAVLNIDNVTVGSRPVSLGDGNYIAKAVFTGGANTIYGYTHEVKFTVSSNTVISFECTLEANTYYASAGTRTLHVMLDTLKFQ